MKVIWIQSKIRNVRLKNNNIGLSSLELHWFCCCCCSVRPETHLLFLLHLQCQTKEDCSMCSHVFAKHPTPEAQNLMHLLRPLTITIITIIIVVVIVVISWSSPLLLLVFFKFLFNNSAQTPSHIRQMKLQSNWLKTYEIELWMEKRSTGLLQVGITNRVLMNSY